MMEAMKTKNLIRMAAIAAIVLGASACSKGVEAEWTADNQTDSSVRTVRFRAGEVSTRTTFGEKENGVFPTLWTGNDTAVKLALNFTEAAVAEVIPDEGYRTASFEAEIDAQGKDAPYTFYAVSPASAAKALSPSREAWNVTIPSVQTPLEGSVDEAAQILAAASESSETIPTEVNIHFNHLTAYGRFSFKNLVLGDATIRSIEMTATTPFVGDWYWNCNEGHVLSDNGASSTLTLQTSRTEDIWFACAPVDMSGQIMVFTVFTDQGALVKEIEFPENRRFTSGRIATFTVDMDGIELAVPGEDVFTLVTSASDLQIGDEVIIANTAGTYGLGPKNTGGNTPYRQAVPITVENGVITDAGNTTPLTLAAGSSSGTWALAPSDGGYLTTTSTKNSLSTSDDISATSSWTISITGSGDATIVAKSGNYPYLRFNYNSGNYSRFSGYGSSSSIKDPVAIYRKASGGASGPVEDDPLTAQTQYGCYMNSSARMYTPGADQMIRSYSSGVQTFTLVGPATLDQMEISGYRRSLVKGDEVTLTVSWRIGFTQYISGRQFTMTVVKEEGPKVWIGDGSGNGFIIKK